VGTAFSRAEWRFATGSMGTERTFSRNHSLCGNPASRNRTKSQIGGILGRFQYLFAHGRTNNGFSTGISSYLFVLRRTNNCIASRYLLEMCRFGDYLFAGANRYSRMRTWATRRCGRYDVDGSSQLAEITRNLGTANFYAVFLIFEIKYRSFMARYALSVSPSANE
jgi:hypothetical protein